MSLLLDTHVVLWWLLDDATLSEEIKARLDDDPDVWVSPVVVWEVAVKQSIGKLKGPHGLPEEIAQSGFRELSVSYAHAVAVGHPPCCTAIPSTGCSSPRPGSRA